MRSFEALLNLGSTYGGGVISGVARGRFMRLVCVRDMGVSLSRLAFEFDWCML